MYMTSLRGATHALVDCDAGHTSAALRVLVRSGAVGADLLICVLTDIFQPHTTGRATPGASLSKV